MNDKELEQKSLEYAEKITARASRRYWKAIFQGWAMQDYMTGYKQALADMAEQQRKAQEDANNEGLTIDEIYSLKGIPNIDKRITGAGC